MLLTDKVTNLRGRFGGALGVLALLCAGCGTAQDPPTQGNELPAVNADEPFTCAYDVVLTRVPPPLADLADQKEVIAQVEAGSWTEFEVKGAEPTPLGPIALVAPGKGPGFDLAVTKLEEMGVELVYPYSTGPEESGVLHDQVTLVLAWKIDEVERAVRRVVRREPGFVDLWVWPDAASIQIFWHGPVPDEVEALVGPLDNGVRVDPITRVPFANKVLVKAQNAVFSDATPKKILDVLSSAGRCNDYRGIHVGVIEQDEARRAEIARTLTDQVGVPVMVVFEERGTLD